MALRVNSGRWNLRVHVNASRMCDSQLLFSRRNGVQVVHETRSRKRAVEIHLPKLRCNPLKTKDSWKQYLSPPA